ncbi:MAG: hypothetical protein L0338_10215 [Acidobacteria bacterium]|nr:hypothetical protein [Acidobacteriota bacterium]
MRKKLLLVLLSAWSLVAGIVTGYLVLAPDALAQKKCFQAGTVVASVICSCPVVTGNCICAIDCPQPPPPPQE